MNIIKCLKPVIKENADWKVKILASYFTKPERVLDFGCGDLSFVKSLKKIRPSLQITGVDVTEFVDRPKDIEFITYDGKRLPFKDNSFDTVVSFYVFHHCEDASESFKECARVARKRVLFVESVYRHPLEIPFMKFMDWIYNIVKPEAVPLSYRFLSFDEWIKVFLESKMKVQRSKKIKQAFLPPFAPVGISYLFEVTKN